MKKTFRLILLVLFAFSLAACVQELAPEEAVSRTGQQTEDGLVSREYTVSFFRDSTRSSLDGLSPRWEEGEVVAVYDPVASKPRVFTVTSVGDGGAVIKGDISEGDFAFSAVYPASAASDWTGLDACTISIPSSQTIAAGSDIAASVMVSRAYSEDPSDGIVFENCVSLLKFTVEREEISSVDLTLKESESSVKTYKVTSSAGTFSTGIPYYLAVAPGTYSKGIELKCTNLYDVSYTKTSTKQLVASRSSVKNLGVVSDGVKRVGYTITNERTIGSLQDFIGEMGLVDDQYSELLDNFFVKLLLNQYFPLQSKPMKYISFTYKSVDPQGKPTTLSGIVVTPQQSIGNSGKTTKGLMLGSHASIATNGECPTESTAFETVVGWMNYSLVMSDYYGFGASKAYPQAYLHSEATARGSIDCLEAAQQLLADMGSKNADKLYNFGYSQGGFNAMANEKYLSEHPERGIKFNQTFAGGGPFDVVGSYDSYLSNMYPACNAFVLISVASFNAAGKLGLAWSDLFQEPLASNVNSWILSKSYGTGSIMSRIGSSDLTRILSPSLVNKSGPAYDTVVNFCRSCSLTEGSWKPQKGSDIYVYHSNVDEMVPYFNMGAMRDYFNRVGATDSSFHYMDLQDVSLPYAVSLILDKLGYDTIDHSTGAVYFVYDAVANRIK